MIEQLVEWSAQQKSNNVSPVKCLSRYKLPELSPEQKNSLLSRNYAPKVSKTTGLPLSEKSCRGWLCEYLKIDNNWVPLPELLFLKEMLLQLPFINLVSRVGLVVLEPNGYINVHSDSPVHYQIAIPLIQDDGFHFVWEDWGEERLLTYTPYVIDINRRHCVWNTGNRRVFLNMTVAAFDSGNVLKTID